MKTRVLTAMLLIFLGSSSVAFCQTQPTPAKPVIPIYDIEGNELRNAHIVTGSVTIPFGAMVEGVPVTLTGSAAFSNAGSYKCYISQFAGMNPEIGTIKYVDGSHFFIREPSGRNSSWRADFLCIGS